MTFTTRFSTPCRLSWAVRWNFTAVTLEWSLSRAFHRLAVKVSLRPMTRTIGTLRDAVRRFPMMRVDCPCGNIGFFNTMDVAGDVRQEREIPTRCLPVLWV